MHTDTINTHCPQHTQTLLTKGTGTTRKHIGQTHTDHADGCTDYKQCINIARLPLKPTSKPAPLCAHEKRTGQRQTRRKCGRESRRKSRQARMIANIRLKRNWSGNPPRETRQTSTTRTQTNAQSESSPDELPESESELLSESDDESERDFFLIGLDFLGSSGRLMFCLT